MTDRPVDTAADMSELSPDDAFSLLGDEVRMEILQTLGQADDPLSFTELRERVGFRHGEGFNYHLDKLAGHYVYRSDDGYQLTRTGWDVVRVVLAGTMTSEPGFDTATVDVACPLCGAPLEISYVDNVLNCACTACAGVFGTDDGSGLLFGFPLPPAAVDGRSPDAVFHATLTYYFHRVATFRSGICPSCAGRVESTVDACDAHQTAGRPHCTSCGRAFLAEVTDVCQACGNLTRGPLRMAVLTHPAVTAFYYDHGIEHRFGSWAAYRRSHHIGEERVQTDPLEMRLTIPAGDERLRLTVDDEATVVEVTRVSD